MLEPTELEIVDNLPAVYHQEENAVIISDLHLGLEKSITYDGGYVPQFQLEDIKKDLKRASELTDAEKIVVNGDLKHDFSKTRFSEREEIEDFLDFLGIYFDQILLVKGNHDTFLEHMEFGDKVEFDDSFSLGNVLVTHGHRKVELDEVEEDTIVIGHEHPALILEDSVGTREKFDCFLHGRVKGKKLLVLPAFSKISGGTNINETPRSELLSPVLRENGVNRLKATAIVRNEASYEFPEIGKI